MRVALSRGDVGGDVWGWGGVRKGCEGECVEERRVGEEALKSSEV